MFCPVCDSCSIKQIYKGRGQIFLFRCKSCNMSFLGSTDYNLKEIHEDYWKRLTKNLEDDYSVGCLEEQNLLLSDLTKRIKKGRLLEVGSGDGRFLKLARQAGWEVAGVELSSLAVSIARQKYGVNCLNGSLQQVYRQLCGQPFDVIVMWGVIEHLKNPIDELKIARLLLRKGGLLVIFTPNADSIFHRLARTIYAFTFGLMKFPMGCLIVSMHQMYFNQQTLRKVIEKCSFSIKEIELRGINLDFVFKAHRNSWWANGIILSFSKIIRKLSHWTSMQSHMIVFAESI